VVSIETVAPLHDSVLAERARSAVEILLQETPDLNLFMAACNTWDLNPVD